MRVEIDTHTHTLASGHAYNTLNEMAQAAADKGLKGLAITEHAPEMPGTCHLFRLGYFLPTVLQVERIVLADLQAIHARYTPAVINAMVLVVDAGSLATT